MEGPVTGIGAGQAGARVCVVSDTAKVRVASSSMRSSLRMVTNVQTQQQRSSIRSSQPAAFAEQ